jgi:hypothetical protein
MSDVFPPSCEACELLLYQFKDSPKINWLLHTLLAPLDEVNDSINEVRHKRMIDELKGASLDILGEIVDFKRNSPNDDEYRPWLKVAVLRNIGHGSIPSIAAILQVLYGKEPPVEIEERASNIVRFYFTEYPTFPKEILFSILRSALPATCKFDPADASSAVGGNNE